MINHTLLEKLTTGFLGLMLFMCLGFQFYALNRGFDITDEGYNLQLVQSRFVGISNTYFFENIQLIFGWLPQTLFVNRIIATFLLLVSCGNFLWTTFRYFKIPISYTNLFFCLLSIPFALTFDPVTLSYNNTTAAYTLFSAGFYFASYLQNENDRSKWLLLFLSGCFASMVCVTKITSGFALSGFLFVLLLLSGKRNPLWIISFGGGWVFYQLLHGWIYTPLFTQVHNILLAGNLFAQMDEHYKSFTLIHDAYLFLKDLLGVMLEFAALFIVVKWVKNRWIKSGIWVLAAAYFFYLFDSSIFYLTGWVYVLFSLLCIAFALVQSLRNDIWHRVKSEYAVILNMLLLFLLPLFVVIGTNNHYNHNYAFATLPLAVLGVRLLPATGWYKWLVLLLTAGCVSFVCYTKILWQPYRIQPLVQQTQLVDEGVLSGILLDASSKERFERLQHVFAEGGFTQEHGLICLGKMQGLQYFLEASSPGGVMFSPTFRELYLENLALDKNEYRKPYYVLSDYRFTDSLSAVSTHWESRFTQKLGQHYGQEISWLLVDSIAFETAPLGLLYIYQSEEK